MRRTNSSIEEKDRMLLNTASESSLHQAMKALETMPCERLKPNHQPYSLATTGPATLALANETECHRTNQKKRRYEFESKAKSTNPDGDDHRSDHNNDNNSKRKTGGIKRNEASFNFDEAFRAITAIQDDGNVFPDISWCFDDDDQ